MAQQQEEGWPLGLQPVNERAGLARNRDLLGSISFNTLTSASPTCSTDSSSDLDTESTGSFFHDRSITLGSLIGVTSVLKLSRRSLRKTKTETREAINNNYNIKRSNNNNKGRTWFCLSLCSSKHNTDTNESVKNVPSLGQFLAVERKASNESHTIYNNGPDEFVQPVSEPNSLFIDDRVAPPLSNSTQVGMMRKNRRFESSLGFLGFHCCFHACTDTSEWSQSN